MASRHPTRSSSAKDGGGAAAGRSSRLEPAVSALCYAAVSVAIILFNKSIISTYAFKQVDVMVCCHMITSVILMHILSWYQLIDLPEFSWETARRSLWLALASVMNVIIGLEALDRVNLAMFTTLRRLTALAIIALEYKVLDLVPDRKTMLGVALMLLGSIVAGLGDLGFDMRSYMFVVANNMASAAYLVLMKTSGNTALGHWTVFYYNCFMSIPLLVIVSLIRGSFTQAMQFPLLTHAPFIAAFITSSILSFFLNYSTFWCTRTNSALTTSITGQTKNLLTTAFGVVLFDGLSQSPINVIGIAISIAGSVVYAWTKLHQGMASTVKIDDVRLLIPLRVRSIPSYDGKV